MSYLEYRNPSPDGLAEYNPLNSCIIVNGEISEVNQSSLWSSLVFLHGVLIGMLVGHLLTVRNYSEGCLASLAFGHS